MIADTSFVVALLNPHDEHHELARKRFDQYSPLTLQQPMLTEILQVAHYSTRRVFGAAEARTRERDTLASLLERFRFHIMPVEDIQYALQVFNEHPTLSFPDACGVADARSSGGLLTFDKKQDRLARSL